MEEIKVFEEFRLIDGYVKYMVSNQGRIINVTTKRILKSWISNNGRFSVSLWKNSKGKNFQVHRLVACAFIENPNNYLEVDHINHDQKDNRLLNLRWATPSQNNMNTRKRSNCTSKYKGVSYNKHAKKWHAKIRMNGKHYHLGCFSDEKDAAKAYNLKAKELFKEFACLNIIEE